MAGRYTLLSPLLACAALALPCSSQDAKEHQERADRWLERHEFQLAENPSFDQLLAQGHTRIDIGIFEVYVTPSALSDAKWLPHVQDSLKGLIDLQATWVEWMQIDDKSSKRFSADEKVLSKWVEGLGKKRISASQNLMGANLIEALGGKDKELSAFTEFAAFMRGGGPLGGPPVQIIEGKENSPEQSSEFPKARLIFAPSREDFVEITALLGVLEKDQQPYFWVPGTNIWTHLDHHGARIISFEFGDGSSDYRASVSMTRKNPKALPQHVAQLGCYALLDSYFGEKMEPMIVGGLASTLLISIFGEADTRIDGDLRARSSAARSMFIAGGNPGGGLLPPSNAQSRWRDGNGKGFFVGLLKASQSKGRSEAKNSWEKLTGFELQSDSGDSMIFHGPILGAGAGELPPENYRGDYLEFIRAYRSAFLHWLVNAAGGSEKSSRTKFSKIMKTISSSDDFNLPELFESTYDAPLSAASGEGLFVKNHEPLEGKFLIWLSKQK